jgi:hypothetical protein
MVRVGLVTCAVVFTVMLFIPMPLRKGEAIHAPQDLTQEVGTARVVARHPIAAFASIEPDRRVEVPAPPLPQTDDLLSPIIVSAPPVVAAEAASDAAPAAKPGPKSLPPREPDFYRVTSAKAALRAGPSSENRKLATLRAGDTVDVLTSFDGKWYFVRLADGQTEGYLEQSDVARADPAAVSLGQ